MLEDELCEYEEVVTLRWYAREAIRRSESGVPTKIRMSCFNRDDAERLRAQLDDEEKTYVIFEWFEFPNREKTDANP